jgi:hypothetical protein
LHQSSFDEGPPDVKVCLNFTAAWRTTEKQMVKDCPDYDLLVKLIDEDILEGLDSIIQDENL